MLWLVAIVGVVAPGSTVDTRRPVPPGLEGKCFNCLADDHIKVD